MKKISFLFVVIAFLSAQIVKAQNIVTTLDATLKVQGTQNEASTVAWLQDPNPDPTIITMPMASFNKEFLSSLSQLNKKYGTFSSINSDIVNDEIVPNLYVDELDPNKLYCFSRYDTKTKKFGNYWRKAKRLANGRMESGLFYRGWDEPVLSVWCWNFGYPDNQPTQPRAPVVQNREVEYISTPGKTTIIDHGVDTVIERFTTYKEVEKNSFTKLSNQSFTLDIQRASYQQQLSSDCGCPKVENKVVREDQPSCGCDSRRICDKHYDELPKKHKKKFFNTTGGRILTHAAAAVGGYFLGRWIFGDGGGSIDQPARIVTQGPLDILPGTNPIYTQGQLQPIYN